MTWSMNAEVVVVSYNEHADLTYITASASKGETYETKLATGPDGKGGWEFETREVPRLYSNTEGEVVAASVTFTVKGKLPNLKIGDSITATGHFTG
jgi:hypothetical protein